MGILDQHNDEDPMVNVKYLNANDRHRTQALSSHGGGVTHLRFTEDGQELLSSGTDKRLRLWDCTTGKNTLMHYPETANGNKLCHFSLSVGGQYVFYPNECNLNVYELKTGRLVRTLSAHFKKIHATCAHPFSMEVYTGSLDTSINVWQPRVEGDNQVDQVLPISGGGAVGGALVDPKGVGDWDDGVSEEEGLDSNEDSDMDWLAEDWQEEEEEEEHVRSREDFNESFQPSESTFPSLGADFDGW